MSNEPNQHTQGSHDQPHGLSESNGLCSIILPKSEDSLTATSKDPLTPAQSEFARMLGRLLARLWDRERE
jgi:hypothetical protein